MNFALAGLGFISDRHKSAIESIGGKVVMTCDNDKSKGADYLDFDEMINSEKFKEVDIISILTPNDLHFGMIKKVVKKVKYIICEKPLTISSKDVEELEKYKNIFSVCQLRYHPLLEEIFILENNIVDMDISVHRDERYFKSWKGQKERSGGVLFNIGIHYFDLLIDLFGEPTEIRTDYLDDKKGIGIIKGDKYFCHWRVGVDAEKESQHRTFRINGKQYDFSNKDNLSFENLHTFVYRDLIKGIGITPKDALPAIKLIEKLNL